MSSSSSVMKSFKSALKNGLGLSESKKCSASLLGGYDATLAVAYSQGDKVMYILLLNPYNEEHLKDEDLFDLSKRISSEFNCFVVPSNPSSHHDFWGTSDGLGVVVYKLNVLREPYRWERA